MSNRTKNNRLVYLDRLVDYYQQHPSVLQIEIFKAQLKREKQEDKILYQSIKEKATR